MSITLYFAKLNLISDDLFKLYEDPKQRKAITFALYQSIKANRPWEKEHLFIDDDGNLQSTIIQYSVHIIGVDKEFTYIEGWVYKKSRLYYKKLDSNTNKLVPQSTENTEGIRFVLNLNEGFVGYNTSTRFGYKEFIEALVNIINLGEEALKYDYRYNISLCTSGLNLDEVKKELHSIGRIKELRIRMQPPNPSEDLLNRLQERCDGLVKNFKDANVTEVELFYSTKGSSGIILDSPMITDKIEDIQGLYSGLPVEESTRKGYVSVEATTTTGKKYTSGESKPIKRIVETIEHLTDACLEAFRQLI